MAIGLYTVRAILDILGVIDYGIYNVVGGVVTLFSFMNRTLSTSSQRYFSIELAHDNKKRLNQLFCLNTNAFLIIGLVIAFFLETVGLWFVNTQMTIPSERLFAANVVYQLSIFSFLFHIIVVPYMALVIAHEKMKVFAYIGVFEALGRLLIVFILTWLTYDKLIVYGILILLLSVSVSLSYIVYCKSHFSESKYRWYWNISEIKELAHTLNLMNVYNGSIDLTDEKISNLDYLYNILKQEVDIRRGNKKKAIQKGSHIPINKVFDDAGITQGMRWQLHKNSARGNPANRYFIKEVLHAETRRGTSCHRPGADNRRRFCRNFSGGQAEQ